LIHFFKRTFIMKVDPKATNIDLKEIKR